MRTVCPAILLLASCIAPDVDQAELHQRLAAVDASDGVDIGEARALAQDALIAHGLDADWYSGRFRTRDRGDHWLVEFYSRNGWGDGPRDGREVTVEDWPYFSDCPVEVDKATGAVHVALVLFEVVSTTDGEIEVVAFPYEAD